MIAVFVRYCLKSAQGAKGQQPMIQRLLVFGLFSIIAISVSSSALLRHPASEEPCAEDHQAWVTHSLVKMETIKPGMTREELLKVFTTEGGTSTGLHRTFASRDCPYFKVDVTFDAVGRPSHDSDGRDTLAEDNRDIIVTVSRPYLQFSIVD
jgi:hypothetical protein